MCKTLENTHQSTVTEHRSVIVWEGRQDGVQRSIRKSEVGVNRYVPIIIVLMVLWVYSNVKTSNCTLCLVYCTSIIPQ